MKRVNCFYRVSSKQQLHGDDIPIQREECRAYLKTHPGWQFEKEYVEKAVSGFTTSLKDRDILQEILQDAGNKAFDVLLVYMSDRIGRKEDESPVFVTTLNNLGIEVWSVKEGQLKTREHIDKLLNYIRFWQAEGESRKTGMRVKDAQETFARAGRFIGGYAPFGYTLEYSGQISNHGRALKHLVIDRGKAEIVKKIFDYAIRYHYGALKIAKVLNREEIPGPVSNWKACTVSQILQNPVYMGYVSYGRRQKSKCGGSYERMPMENWILADKPNPELVIVSEETWHKALELRERRKSNMRNSIKKNGHPYSSTTGKLALMGLVYCGYCGCRLTNGSKYDYWTTGDGEKKKKMAGRYRCTKAANGSLSCEGKPYYRSEDIEPIILNVAARYLDGLKEADTYDELLKLQELQRKSVKKEIDKLAKEIKAAQKDIQTLRENIPAALRGEGLFSAEQLSALINGKEAACRKAAALWEERKKEDEELKLHKEGIEERGNMVSHWGSLFESSSIPEKKVILAKLIERIDVWENDIKITFRISREEFSPLISGALDRTLYTPDSW